MATERTQTRSRTEYAPRDVGVEKLSGEVRDVFQVLAELLYQWRDASSPQGDFARAALADGLTEIASALQDWPRKEAVAIVEALSQRLEKDFDRVDFLPADVVSWLGVHLAGSQREDRSDAVIDCLELHPPLNVRIVRRLAHAGSQKIVYEARWKIGEREVPVALKQLREAFSDALNRELLAHPLSVSHPNIVRTYSLQNTESPPEDFLVEAWLKHPLNDEWRASGIDEAASLLVDLARALTFLHDLSLIHGDVKPDNTGVERELFVLLDFGIARPRTEFTGEVTPTGSLRTRAPELLTGEGIHAEKTDVWALGATVFNTIVGRFPLFRTDGDEVPKAIGSHGESERAEFATELSRRARDEWDFFLAPVFDPAAADPAEARVLVQNDKFRRLLAKMLAREPDDRPTALEVLHQALRELPALIGDSGGRVFAPASELSQLDRYLGTEEDLRLLPLQKRRELTDRLGELEESLNSQRYSRSVASELIDSYGDVSGISGLTKKDRSIADSLMSALREFRGPYADVRQDRLVGQLRERLDIDTTTDDEDYRKFLDALGGRIAEASENESFSAIDGGAFVRQLKNLERALAESE